MADEPGFPQPLEDSAMIGATLRKLSAAVLLAGLLSACGRAQQALPDFADLVEQDSPSVVNISTSSEAASQPAKGGVPAPAPRDAPPGDWYHKFFDDEEDGGNAPDEQMPEQSLGSGFILWPDGYILT